MKRYFFIIMMILSLLNLDTSINKDSKIYGPYQTYQVADATAELNTLIEGEH